MQTLPENIILFIVIPRACGESIEPQRIRMDGSSACAEDDEIFSSPRTPRLRVKNPFRFNPPTAFDLLKNDKRTEQNFLPIAVIPRAGGESIGPQRIRMDGSSACAEDDVNKTPRPLRLCGEKSFPFNTPTAFDLLKTDERTDKNFRRA